MEEIKVGEYVRSKKGYIGKVIKIRERIETYKNDRDAYLVDWCGKRATYISQIKNIEHSEDIIDLVQVGDYVNGKKVTKTKLDKTMNSETAILCGDSNYDCLDVIYKNWDIKSIVTREAMKSVEYTIE